MKSTHSGVGQVMTQNCSVEMVNSVDPSVSDTSSCSFPTLLYFLIKQWTSLFSFCVYYIKNCGEQLVKSV